jgi:hypothetical protein
MAKKRVRPQLRRTKQPPHNASHHKHRRTVTKPADQTTVDEHIQQIQQAYTIGQKLLKSCPKHIPNRERQERAKKHGISEGTAGRYRQMAEIYSQSDLDALYREFRTEKHALVVTHFFVLIGVPDRTTRKAMAQEAVKRRLSVSGLRKLKQLQKIGKSGGNGKSGGRKPATVRLTTTAELQEAVYFEMGKWRRWLDQFPMPPHTIKPSLKKRLQALQTLVKSTEDLSRNQVAGNHPTK